MTFELKFLNMEETESKNQLRIVDWLPYISGLLAGTGFSQIALGLFVVRNPDDTLLYVALVFFALAIVCWLASFVFRRRRVQP
jgi:hypothetical protein